MAELGQDGFVSAVRMLADRNMTVGELIDAAASLKASNQADLVGILYKLWVKHNQDHPLLHVILFNYAVALSESGDQDSARQALEQAISLNADFYPAYVNLGSVYERVGAVDKAMMQWSTMLDRLGSVTGSTITYKTTALKNLGRVLESARHAYKAESLLRESLDLDPAQRDVVQHFISLRLSQCKWPILVPWERVSRETLIRNISPLSVAAYADDPMFQLATACNESRSMVGFPAPCPKAKRDLAERPKRLRVGYVSSDLRGHAVGFLMAEVFDLHNRDRFEVFAYYCGIPFEDDLQKRIKGKVEHWIDLTGIDSLTAAHRIAADGIDVLIDLNGHTRDARTAIFAMRPAPIQVNWLGFPGSMGTPYHHYIIADDWIIPKEYEIYYSEKVVRLPCYQPNDRRRMIAPTRPTRAEAGLPETGMVYCCFNGVHKITRTTFERWMAVLRQVPDGVLWLLSGGEADAHLGDLAEQHGISRERLVFASPLSNPQHLARYPLADLFIDTMPYGAHTTASDALWMGVPVLTLSGYSFASRVCGSLVRSAGLGRLVCSTSNEFVERASALGTDRTQLQHWKDTLAAERERCVLFDTDQLVDRLEGLYEQMWQDFVGGCLPRPDLTNLDVYLDLAIAEDYDSIDVSAIENYQGWYKERLARRHRAWPIPPDGRLWSAADIAAAEE
jgi:predicted O-linked N-acetylglucosamine transferase (SPINDLY family)